MVTQNLSGRGGSLATGLNEKGFLSLHARVNRRRLCVKLVAQILRSFVFASVTLAGFVLVDKLVWLDVPFSTFLAVSFGIWLVAAVANWIRWRRSAYREAVSDIVAPADAGAGAIELLATAEFIDDRMGLNDRLSSAMALILGRAASADGAETLPRDAATPADVRAAVISDAFRTASTVKTTDVVRFHAPRRAALIPVILLASWLGWAKLGTLDLFQRRKSHDKAVARRKIVQQTARQYAQAVRVLHKEAKKKDLDPAQEYTGKLEDLVKQLEQKPPERRKALKELSELQREIKAAREKLQKDQIANVDQKQVDKLSQMAALKQALAAQDYQKAAEELKKLQDQLKQMQDRQNQQGKQGTTNTQQGNAQLTPQEKQQIQQVAQEMEKLAKALQNNPQLQKQLQQCARNMQNQDLNQAQANARQIQKMLDALKQVQQNDQALQQALNQIQNMKQCMGANNLGQLQKQLSDGTTLVIPNPNPGDGNNMPGGMPDDMGAGQGDQQNPNNLNPGGVGPSLGGRGKDQMIGPGGDEANTPMAVRTKIHKAVVVHLVGFRGPPRSQAQVKKLQQVIAAASAETSNEAIDKQALPLNCQEMVKRYFSSLENVQEVEK